jgi:hypothetical protein
MTRKLQIAKLSFKTYLRWFCRNTHISFAISVYAHFHVIAWKCLSGFFSVFGVGECYVNLSTHSSFCSKYTTVMGIPRGELHAFLHMEVTGGGNHCMGNFELPLLLQLPWLPGESLHGRTSNQLCNHLQNSLWWHHQPDRLLWCYWHHPQVKGQILVEEQGLLCMHFLTYLLMSVEFKLPFYWASCYVAIRY